MEITILAFGQIADLIGLNTWKEQDVPDTNELKQKLEAQFAPLSQTKYAIAVNRKMVSDNTPLTDGTVVALLPPFSGG